MERLWMGEREREGERKGELRETEGERYIWMADKEVK